MLAALPSAASSGSGALNLDTLTSYLARVAGPDARDIRVNSVYGSAHDGAWQFIAHLTWYDDAGVIHGGSTELPVLAGSHTLRSPFGSARLTREEQMGWSLPQLQSALRHFQPRATGLALIDLQITSQTSPLVACVAARPGNGRCISFDTRGQVTDTSAATVTDDPTQGALSVAHTP